MTLSDSFRHLSSCKINVGDTVLFWNDKWDLGVLSLWFPQLYSFVRNGNILVQKFLSQTAHQNFHTPLSEIASQQLQDLAELVMAVAVDSQSFDQWSYVWNSPTYVVKKAYDVLKGSIPTSPIFKWMWESSVVSRNSSSGCF